MLLRQVACRSSVMRWRYGAWDVASGENITCPSSAPMSEPKVVLLPRVRWAGAALLEAVWNKSALGLRPVVGEQNMHFVCHHKTRYIEH